MPAYAKSVAGYVVGRISHRISRYGAEAQEGSGEAAGEAKRGEVVKMAEYVKNRAWTAEEIVENTAKSLSSMVAEVGTGRKDFLRDSVGKMVVDTCVPSDTGLWETGVTKPDGEWIIVEDYLNAEEAKAGHAAWVQHVKAGKKLPKDIHIEGSL